MKNLFKILKMLMLLGIVGLHSCEEDREDDYEDEEETTTTAASPYGSWKRGDGITAYVKFENTKAFSCDNTGKITEGTFSSSEPSMTYNIQGNIIKFPLKFYNDGSMLVGVPNQAINTNNATMYYKSDKFCDAGGGGTGGGGGGGNGQGKATFWTQKDHCCGTITVSVAGSSGSVSQFYSATPECGATGCANFTLPAGNHTFTAKCGSYSWSGTVTVTENGCFRMQLN